VTTLQQEKSITIKKIKKTNLYFCQSRSNLESYMNQINTQTDVLVEKLRLVADDNTLVKMYDYFNLATIDVIANVYTGFVIYKFRLFYSIQ
jgi:uncharacterized protein YoxC